MDKQKVIEAYRRGLITLQECGQILGADKSQINDLLSVGNVRRSMHPTTLYVTDHV